MYEEFAQELAALLNTHGLTIQADYDSALTVRPSAPVEVVINTDGECVVRSEAERAAELSAAMRERQRAVEVAATPEGQRRTRIAEFERQYGQAALPEGA